jgi:hypothetical protein
VYDTLIESSQFAVVVIVGLALLYLVAGLARPSWAWASGRGVVVLRAALAMVVAAAIFIGVIAYTHAQPDGPHSIDSYLKDYNPQPTPGSAQPDAAPAPKQP